MSGWLGAAFARGRRWAHGLMVAGVVMALFPLVFSPVSQAGSELLTTIDVTSHANHQVYRLLVSKPQGPAPAAGYPVVYLLDGNVTAPLTVKWLATHGLADAVVVVGIGYPDTKRFNVARRFQDLTFVESPDRAGTGQARAFFGFVSAQVRPLIEKRFRVDPNQQILFGHSLGGLAVLRQFVEQPDAFSAYLAASPSLWWAHGAMRQKLQSFVRQGCEGVSGRPRIVITVGEEEHPHAGAGQQHNHKLAQRHMVDNARWAADWLKTCPHVQTGFQVLHGADHGQALGRGLFFGLAALFTTTVAFEDVFHIEHHRMMNEL